MLNEVAPNICWLPPDHTTDRPVLTAVAGEQATLMVDAGASAKHAREFLEALGATSVPPVTHVVLTHCHWDHVFGAAAIDATVIAGAETGQELRVMAGYAWSDAALDERVAAGLEIPFCRDMMKAELSPDERAALTVRIPDETFRTERELDLGNRSVRLLHVGGDHASDSCIAVVPGVAAILGDCVYPNVHTEPNFYTWRRVFPLLDRLLALDVRHYVLGHDDAPLSRPAFEAFARTLRAVGEAVRRHPTDADAIERAIADAGSDPHDPEVAEIVEAFRAGLADEAD